MKITITGKNIEVSDYLEALVEKKVRKLERYFKTGTQVQVTLSVEKNRHIAEVTIPFEGIVVRGEEVTGDMYASIDNVLDKLEKQIHKHRTKLDKKLKEGAFSFAQPEFSEKFEESETRKIVRTKRIAIKPMSVDEAAMQLELLGHSFYVFTNADTGDVNVLYIRKDGNIGLIEPGFYDD